jgi:ribosome maturation factor RimP
VPGRDSIAAAIEPVLAGLGLDLYDVDRTGSGRARTLRVTVDREGGVDLDTITAATERISPVVDAHAEVDGPFTLEVSSPGLERPLRRPEHFRRAIDAVVSVKFRDADGHVRRVRGRLVSADDDGITIAVDDTTERVAYDHVTQAHTVFEFGPAPKAGKSKKRARKKEVAR